MSSSDHPSDAAESEDSLELAIHRLNDVVELAKTFSHHSEPPSTSGEEDGSSDAPLTEVEEIEDEEEFLGQSSYAYKSGMPATRELHDSPPPKKAPQYEEIFSESDAPTEVDWELPEEPLAALEIPSSQPFEFDDLTDRAAPNVIEALLLAGLPSEHHLSSNSFYHSNILHGLDEVSGEALRQELSEDLSEGELDGLMPTPSSQVDVVPKELLQPYQDKEGLSTSVSDEPETTVFETFSVETSTSILDGRRFIQSLADDLDEEETGYQIPYSKELEKRPELIEMIKESIKYYLTLEEELNREMIEARDEFPWVSYKISQSNQRIFTFDISGGEWVFLQLSRSAKLVSAVGGLSTNFPASNLTGVPLFIFLGMILIAIGFITLLDQGIMLNVGLLLCCGASCCWFFQNIRRRLTFDVSTSDFIINEKYQGRLECLREVKVDSNQRIVAVLDYKDREVEEIIAPRIPQQQRDYLVKVLNREITILRAFERNI